MAVWYLSLFDGQFRITMYSHSQKLFDYYNFYLVKCSLFDRRFYEIFQQENCNISSNAWKLLSSTVPYLLTPFHLLSNVIIHLTVNFNYIRRSNTGSASFLLQFCNLFLKKSGFFQSKFIMALKSPMSQKGSKA